MTAGRSTAGPVVASGVLPEEVQEGLAADPQGGVRSATADAALFTGATYVAQGLTFVAGIAQKALLGPLGAGYWGLMQSFWTYLTIAPLGAMNATGRQVPAYRGRGDYQAAAAVSDTGSSFSVLAIGAVGTILAAVALLAGAGWPDEIRYGLVLLGALAPLRMFADCHKSVFQATKRFDASSITAVAEAGILLTAQTACVLAFGFYGMFLGLGLSIVGLYLLWMRLGLVTWRRPSFRWRIDRSRIPELISFGLPLMLQGQVWLLFMGIDNLIVAGFISVRDLGYYVLAVSVTGYVLHLPRSIGAALFPRMTEEFVKTERIESIRHYAVDTQRLLAYMLVPVFLGGAYYLVPVLIRHGLPEFEPAVPVVHIMVAASFLIALVNMPTKVLTTAGYRWGITGLTLACLAINATANYIAVAVLEWGIEGAAAATAFSYLIAFLVLTSYALTKMMRPLEVVSHLGELLLVFAYVIGSVWGIEWLIGSGAGPLLSDLLLAILKLAVFLVAIGPLVASAERRFRVLGKMTAQARRALGRPSG